MPPRAEIRGRGSGRLRRPGAVHRALARVRLRGASPIDSDAVKSQASSDHVGTHRNLTRFCEVDKMSEDITNPPSVAPGRRVPRSLVECLDLVRQLETLTS